MLYLGITVVVLGVVLFVATQIIIRKLISNYKKSWEDENEVS